VIFPPRWLVAENTFKPPYYHRNTMTEYMGNIHGVYDAKENAFGPGCSSLHSCMTPHGPEDKVFEKASNSEDVPIKLSNTLSFMFETCNMIKLFKASQNYINVDTDYYKVSKF
jgi:homogentisate 1,2-dioxygenase